MEEGQILYGAWYGVGALLMLMVLIMLPTRKSVGVVAIRWWFDSAHQH